MPVNQILLIVEYTKNSILFLINSILLTITIIMPDIHYSLEDRILKVI